MTNAIEARGLVKTYPGDVRALDGLGFEVEAGTVFGLLGPNGAGKSTTVKILTTLSRADEGTAAVAGHDVGREPADVRRAIGVVAQRSGVDREATGRENLELQGASTAWAAGSSTRGERAARPVRPARRGRPHRPHVLGRHAAAARHRDRARPPAAGAVPRRADDRPRPRGAGRHVDGDRAPGRDEGLTILLTTHYLEEADQLARRLAIVDRGRVVAEGTPEELKRELRGDAVQAGARRGERRPVRAALDPLDGSARSRCEGRSLRARADDGARAVPAVLEALDAAASRSRR